MKLTTTSLVWFFWVPLAVWLVLAAIVVVGFLSDFLMSVSDGVYGAFLLLPIMIVYVGIRTFIDLKRQGASRRKLRIMFIVTMLPVLGYLVIPMLCFLLWSVGTVYLHVLRGQ